MPTATNLGLGGEPVQFLGAYVINVNNSLGLAQSPSTANVTLVEDECVTPPVLFEPPTLGQYVELKVGSNFAFCGVVTKYEQDIRNISGRSITVDIADPREIMKSIPIILAPGFRGVVAGIEDTGCSVIDAFGAFDDPNSGFNLAGWTQAGVDFGTVLLAFNGGTKVVEVINGDDIVFDVDPQVARAFGERYLFDLSEIEPLINKGQLINTNLISVADFVQELANSNLFDWYTESSKNATDGLITVVIKPISRRTDNTDIDLDAFLALNSGLVINAKRGFELRNDVACSVILGAPVEFMQEVSIRGLANNPVDLSSEGGSDRYFMVEDEMRAVLANKISWESWVERNGGLGRYGVVDMDVIPLFSTVNTADDNQLGRNPDRIPGDKPNQENRRGRIFDKLKGAAEATYGKRFLYRAGGNTADAIDAAWTADAGVAPRASNANEYFRNKEGKTRAYVEFEQTLGISDITEQPPTIIGFQAGIGPSGPQPLNLSLASDFVLDNVMIELDKADYIIISPRLYVAATIEEGNVVKLDAPAIVAKPDILEFQKEIEALREQGSTTTADGVTTTKAKKDLRRNDGQHGGISSLVEVHAKAYQPVNVFIPTRDRITRYGPVFSSNIIPTSQGKLEIIQDDAFAPWEIGTTQGMLDAMQFKVDNQSSDVKVIETADITIENFPKFSVGESLGLNSNINNISISFGSQVTTTYRLQSFQRKFGQLSKEELAALSLFARRSGARTLPQDTVGFIERFRARIQKQFSGRGASSGSANTGGGSSFE